ncbi:hypothetical protein [Ahniella affigens]|uniref:hypothetical protein n=1 Tax=Ahniella affigens TaxID=2021234 RepID=UPI0011B260A2|nr:hypothetical protein [Ahniella affigens]
MLKSRTTLSIAIVAAIGAGHACANDLGEWQSYARAAVTPNFDWAESATLVPTVLDRGAQTTLKERFSIPVRNTEQTLSLSVGRSALTDLPVAHDAGNDRSMLNLGRNALVRDIVAPTFSTDTGAGTFSAGVIIAEQRFASLGMGATVAQRSEDLTDRTLPIEKVAGTGVRVGYSVPLSQAVAMDTFVQSRINMEALHAYRGVFSDPGDFDVPSQAGVTVRYQFAPKWQMSVSADRIRYSELTAFSSTALPTRFLSLLGDSGSPEFVWEDLDVFGAELSYAINPQAGLVARYGTHQQPEPTESILRNALSDAISSGYVALGYEQNTRNLGRFALNATYADSQAFLGNVSATNKDATGPQVEVEATWRFDF